MPEPVVIIAEPSPAPPARSPGGGGSSSSGSSIPLLRKKYVPKLELTEDETFEFQTRDVLNVFNTNSRDQQYGLSYKRYGPLRETNFKRTNAIGKETGAPKSVFLIEDKATDTITKFIDPEWTLSQDRNARIEFEDTNFYVNDIVNVFDQLDSDEDGITKQVFNVYDQFGRFADPGGLKHHSDNIREGRSDLRSTIESFFASDEFKPTFSGLEGSTDEKIDDIFEKSVFAVFDASLTAVPVANPYD